MSSNRSRGTEKKSAKRTKVVDEVMAALSDDRILNTLDYRKKSEAYLKQYMHQPASTPDSQAVRGAILGAISEAHRVKGLRRAVLGRRRGIRRSITFASSGFSTGLISS